MRHSKFRKLLENPKANMPFIYNIKGAKAETNYWMIHAERLKIKNNGQSAAYLILK